MNSIRIQLLKHYPEAIETFGFVTKANRELSSLDKSHYTDAITIARGCIPEPIIDTELYKKLCIPKGQYQLYQGQNSEKKLPRGKLHGFNNYDKVRYCEKEAIISGRRSNGYFDLIDVEGNKIDFSYLCRGYKTPRWDRLRLIERRSTTICIKEKI